MTPCTQFFQSIQSCMYSTHEKGWSALYADMVMFGFVVFDFWLLSCFL